MACAPMNTYSSEVPPEVWHIVTQELDKQDTKELRLVNSFFKDIATPHCFKQVTFDISRASVTNLTKIASTQHLASHVRILVLQRLPRMREIPNTEVWMQAVSQLGGLENELPLQSFYDCNTGDVLPRRASQQTKDQLEALHEDYNDQWNATHEGLKSLSARLCHGDCACRKQVSSKDCVIGKLVESFKQFKNLTSFKHKPAILWEDRWVHCWQGLRIELEYTDSEVDEDDDSEALHLGSALIALGLAKQHLSRLESVVFRTRGQAFWSPYCLRRLQQGKGYFTNSQERELQYENFIREEQGLQRKTQDNQLETMKSTLEKITHFDCLINEITELDLLSMVTSTVLEFLCHSKELRKLCLTFGRVHGGRLQFDWPSSEDPRDAPKTFLTSLTKCKPWSKIQELKLQIVTGEDSLLPFLQSISKTLRNLTLSNVKFGPSSGTWESVLLAIVSSLENLETLDLEYLSEYAENERKKRSLFCPESEKWKGKTTSYNDLKQRVLGHLLKDKELHVDFPDLVTTFTYAGSGEISS